jgi:signal transduction histidine kinase
LNKKLEDKQEEIILQNEELSKHKDHLELLVKERTSELLEAKEKAEESDHLKTAFLHNMSHEIRTPLNAIMGFSEILPDNFENKEILQKFSDIIKQKGNDLLELVNSILDIAKIESGQLSLNIEKINLKGFIEEMEIFFIEYQKRINKEHIQFIFKKQIKNPNLEIFIDQGKLKQILNNLIGNAFKFTTSGKIEVGCGLIEDNKMNFYITDTGIGIPKEKQEMIFERFRQIDEFTYHEGTGLGLSISKGLIQLLGGEIWLESEVSKGSTFHFTISYIKDKVVSDKIRSQHIYPVDLNNRTIIIAEDDYISFLYLKELFKDYKINLVYAENGQVLMDMLENSLPDLVLLDIKMPKKSGFECLKEIRTKHLKTKVILQTAYAMDVEITKCYEEGCNGYITKPIRKDDLFKVISEVLNSEL